MEKEIGENGEDRDGETLHCLSYYLPKYEDAEVIVSFSTHKYRNGSIALEIGEEVIKMTSPTHYFEGD